MDEIRTISLTLQKRSDGSVLAQLGRITGVGSSDVLAVRELVDNAKNTDVDDIDGDVKAILLLALSWP